MLILVVSCVGIGGELAGEESAPPTSSTSTVTVPTTSRALTTIEPPSTTDAPPTTEASTTSQLPPPSTAPSTVPETGSDVLPPGVVEAILLDVADLTGVDIEQITVALVEEETFNDASLGCPQPGEVYAQVITPGFEVIVQADNIQLDYRVDEQTGSFKLCEQ